jgi:hypothetical protein
MGHLVQIIDQLVLPEKSVTLAGGARIGIRPKSFLCTKTVSHSFRAIIIQREDVMSLMRTQSAFELEAQLPSDK